MGTRPESTIIPSVPVTMPRPEEAALAVLAAYSKRYRLTITVSRGTWTVAGPGLAEPARIEMYTNLVCWLAQTFGGIE